MRTARFVFRGCLAASLVICGARAALPAQRQGSGSKRETLEKRLEEQGRRIAELEERVRVLAAAVKEMAQRPDSKETPGGEQPVAAVAAARLPAADAAAKPPAAPELRLGPAKLNGDVYLFQYVPHGLPGAHPRFELYALSLKLSGQHGPWEFYSDYRLRTTKLRSFFPGNTWLQEGYVGYRTPLGRIRAGSFYRRVGLVWDDSFFGNLEYFDGLKLAPEFGLGFDGEHRISERWGAEYSAQYFTTDARVNGSLPGRDFVSEAGARAKNDVTVRFAPVWHFSDSASLSVGGSYAHGVIERDAGPHNARRQVAGDVTLRLGGLLTYGEILDQKVDGVVISPPQNATYSLVGARWTRGRFQPRLNYSNANYHGFNPRREYIVQPGITVKLAEGFSFLYEYDFWRRVSTPSPTTLDQSLNLVLLYHF